jgi:hypothetical protein
MSFSAAVAFLNSDAPPAVNPLGANGLTGPRWPGARRLAVGV